MEDIIKNIQSELNALSDIDYREFHSRLIPDIPKDTILGVRTPILRKYAASISNDKEKSSCFMACLPHRYYEENNLHAFLIEKIKDYDEAIAAIDIFLPYIDNWATCDMMSPKVLGKNKEKLYLKIKEWIASGKTYTVRYGIEMLMKHYLDEYFKSEYLDIVSSVRSDEYYVNMMVAWYFATALAKQYTAALPYIEQKKLESWTHNKAIQKAVESYRITNEQKAYLKTLKIKKT